MIYVKTLDWEHLVRLGYRITSIPHKNDTYACVDLNKKTFTTDSYVSSSFKTFSLEDFKKLLKPKTFPKLKTLEGRINLLKHIEYKTNYELPERAKLIYFNDLRDCVLKARDGVVQEPRYGIFNQRSKVLRNR
tara:strand:+ start:414 stop:812 length:399 start_codon:yes stop_codon:yes gene_type:complete